MRNEDTISTLAAAIIIIAIALAIIIFVPIAFIWSLNTLFPITISYNFGNWLAALVLIGILALDRS